MISKLDTLINRLIELDIQIELEGESNLRIKKSMSDVPADVLSDLKEQKGALIDYFLRKKSQSGRQQYQRIPSAEKQEFYALSSAQKRLYFLQRLSPDSTSYNMQYYHFFNEKLDRKKLEQSLQKLIDRHEILRTSFVEVQGKVVQKIEEEISFGTDYYECAEIAEVNDMAKASVRPFDLGKGPLFRSVLIQIKDSYLWMVDIHHIISDGTSQGILISDLISIYQGAELPPLMITYKDYSEWQNKLGISGELAKQQEYWQGKLSGELPRLDLPADFPRPTVFTFKGARCSFTIDKKQTAQLKALGDRHKGTLQMSMMAILKVLLFRYTGQEDLVVGCGISGRSHPELNDMAGLFVNMLAIRSNPAGDMRFATFYAKLIADSLEAYENQDLQFDDLVDVLKIPRDVSRNPIFDIALVTQNFTRTEIEGEYDIVRATLKDGLLRANAENMTAKFDLTFIVDGSGEETNVTIEYYTDIFKESTVSRIAAHFSRIADQILADENILLSDINILSDAEKEKLLKEFNRTAVKYPKDVSIHSLLARHVSLSPDKIAISDENGSYTYLELEKLSNKLSNFLKEHLKVQAEACIGILQSRKKEIVPSILAVLKTGGAYLNLDPKLPEERLLYMLKDAGVKCILTEDTLVGLASRLQWRSEAEHIVCVNSGDIYSEHGGLTNDLMRKDLWDYVGDRAGDAITAGGWLSSYTGIAISQEEMQEYSDNAYLKLESILHKKMKVLEIGCSSGLTMFKVAPKVGRYYGTDLSSSILEHTKQAIALNGHTNVSLHCMPAHDIDTLGEKDFDLVIINSVVQCFEDHNYLRSILQKSVSLLKDRGYIFAGDIMDEDRRLSLIEELKAFKRSGAGAGLTTKTDWSSELFVSRDYFNDLFGENLGITKIDFSDKIHTIENELTKFRYDAFIHVNKNAKPKKRKKVKKQFDLSAIGQCDDSLGRRQKISGRNLCYVVYTSGSTGQPKGVMIEHHSLVNLCAWQTRFLGMESSSISTQCADIGFDAFAFELFPILVAGGSLEIIPESKRLSVRHLVRFLAEKSVTHTFLPTPLYHEVLSAGLSSAMPRLTIWVGGDRLKHGAIDGTRLYNCYGPSECTVCVTAEEVSAGGNGLPLIGKPIDNTGIFILDADNKIQPVGIAGEICISGAGLARGYLNQEGLSAEKFIPHPFKKGEKLYKTGDLGRWTEDGSIEFLGRRDEQVKIRGYRIEPGEIEQALLKHEQIEEALVLAKENAEGEKELIAYLTVRSEQNISDLRAFLKTSLPEYMLPAYYVQLDAFPRNANGKIDRRSLPDPQGQGLRTGADYVAARNPMEQKIIRIWEKILQTQNIGVNDDFFALGGHSLKAVRLSNEYQKELSVNIALKDLFACTTVASQAVLIRSSEEETFVQIEKVVAQKNYPISDAQRRLWVLSQFEEGSVAYNMPSSIYLCQDVDLDSFKKAIDTTIERHEILRTVFREEESGEIRQWVLRTEELSFNIDHKDFRKEVQKQARVDEYIGSDAYKAFDLANGPLLRAALLRVEDDGYVFYFNMHHIISDGWSMEVLRNDVFACYEAYRAGKAPRLKPLRIQYKDYSARQLAQLASDAFSTHRAYWLKSLEGELPLMNLPSRKQRPQIKTYNGHKLHMYLGPEATGKLKKYSESNGGSLFMGLLATLNVLLYRYTSQTDIIIGTAVAGREHADLEEQIGFYVNTLALRNKVDPEESFHALFSGLKQNTLEAYSHQVYPFDRLVEELNVPRDISRSAVFDVMLVLQNNGEKRSAVELEKGQENVILDIGPGTSKFDLLLSVQEQGECLSVMVEYNTDVYDRPMIERLMAHYKTLVPALLSDPAQALKNVSYLSQSEEQQLLAGFNDTETTYSAKTVVELFEEQVIRTPDKTALQFGEDKLSYKELSDLSNSLADLLRKKYQVSNKVRVGVMLERSLDSVVSMIGVMKTGACYVPVDHNYPTERLVYIAEDAELDVIISTAALWEKHGLKRSRLVDIKEMDLGNAVKAEPLKAIAPDDLSFVIYTSGSTGRPKGVLQTHRMMSNLIQWDIHHSGITPGLKYLQYASFSFDASLHDLYFVLSSGGSAYIARESSRLDYQTLLQEILENDVEVLSMPFSALNAFCLETEIDKIERHSIKFIVSTAEQLYVNMALRKFLEKNPGVELHNHYGPSETHVVTSYRLSSRLENIVDRPSIGKPVSNSRIYILDQYKKPVPEGVTGELYIGGANLAEGYLNQEDLTREKFVKDPFKEGQLLYRTGDQGYWRSDGNIEFAGRKDDQVKVRGYRIEPGEIAQVLQAHEEIDEAVVVARKNQKNDVELVAYITSGKAQSVSALRGYLKTILPEYMLPGHYVQLEALPLTSNGKIDKVRLPDPEGLGLSSGVEYVAPRNETERRLARIWEKVLQKERIGIKDDFFSLGGHSLKAIQLSIAVRNEFNLKFNIRSFFQNSSIELFAEEVERVAWLSEVKEEDNTTIIEI